MGNEVGEILEDELQKQGNPQLYGNAKEFRKGSETVKNVATVWFYQSDRCPRRWRSGFSLERKAIVAFSVQRGSRVKKCIEILRSPAFRRYVFHGF